MTRPVSVRGTHPEWPLNRLVSALPAGWDTLDTKDIRDGQAQAYVTRCPGPSHTERTGGTRDLLLAEYPSGYLLVRCFGECDPRIVLHHFGLQVQDMSTGPDGRALSRSEEDEPEPPVPLPAYPVALLPEALRQLVLSGAAAGLPTELVAGAGLGVASMVSMPARILPDRGRTPARWAHNPAKIDGYVEQVGRRIRTRTAAQRQRLAEVLAVPGVESAP